MTAFPMARRRTLEVQMRLIGEMARVDNQVRRPRNVVMVDAENPLVEVRGEFFWREEHERILADARTKAYEAGFASGFAAARREANPVVVKVSRRRVGIGAALFRSMVAIVLVAALLTILGAVFKG